MALIEPEAVNRTILLLDIENLNQLDDHQQMVLRQRLNKVVQELLAAVGVGQGQEYREDHGDGLIILIRDDISKSTLLRELLRTLPDALHAHNNVGTDDVRMQLRMVLAAGEVLLYTAHATSGGVLGYDLNQAFRLLDSSILRMALKERDSDYVLCVSRSVYEGTVRHRYRGVPPEDFQHFATLVKSDHIEGWLYVGGQLPINDDLRLAGSPEQGTRRPLAGVRSDTPSKRDFFGSTNDAEILAELISATTTSPPLAIALLGEWGAGKSSLMLQISSRVDELASLARAQKKRSDFAAHVRQVHFNAWDYSDGHVWAGIVDHLFHSLETSGSDSVEESPAPEELAELRRRKEQLLQQEQRLNAAMKRSGMAPRGLLKSIGSPLQTIRSALALLWSLWSEVWTRASIFAAWIIIAAAAVAFWHWGRPQIAALLAAFGWLTAPAVAMGRRLLAWHRETGRVTGFLGNRLSKQHKEVLAEAGRVKARLAELSAADRLKEFVKDRSADNGYAEQRGLLGEVHRDLARLVDDLHSAREQWQSDTIGDPPLERIVLYIDDLDRCPPDRVVEVLEAVHLMLALPLFVVVVAVDPRWLLRALWYHHRDFFAGTGTPCIAEYDLATPVDYLDKIFQIPYAVTPFTSKNAHAYMSALLTPHTASGVGDSNIPNPGDQSPGTGGASTDLPRSNHEDAALSGAATVLNSEDVAPKSSPRPEALRLTVPEANLLTQLAPLVPTPRAANRLANLYRLVRIGLPSTNPGSAEEEDVHFTVIQILLLIIVAVPTNAETILTGITRPTTDAAEDLLSFLSREQTDAPNWDASQLFRNRLVDTLNTLIAADPSSIVTDLAAYRRWAPRLARHSFHIRTAPTTQSNI